MIEYKTLSTKIRSDLKAQIEQKAKEQGQTPSKFISTVLEAFLTQSQPQPKKKDYEKIALYILVLVLSFLLLR